MAYRKIRDVVYGFIDLDEQECEIIDHPDFQRLRRIKQLSLTDMVYPGAVHTRFEHSLGVMQMATDIFECIVRDERSEKLLREMYGLDDTGLKIIRKTLRLAALLHDVGHAPFSHTGEDLMPINPINGKCFSHEQYSIEIIKRKFKEIIEENNYNIRVEDVTFLLEDETVEPIGKLLLWKEIISGQLDADRSDYLLRDSLHLGVKYGLFDRNLLVDGIMIGKTNTGALKIAVKNKAWHIAESIVLARYQMFTQVYYHKVRRIYDYHISCAAKEVLKNNGYADGCYPAPTSIDEYLGFDDDSIISAIKSGTAGKHGEIIRTRSHYKCKYQTQLVASPDERNKIFLLEKEYEGKEYYLDDLKSAPWYKKEKDIQVCDKDERLVSLSEMSEVVKALNVSPMQQRFYIPREL